jgi:hypothetical protein
LAVGVGLPGRGGFGRNQCWCSTEVLVADGPPRPLNAEEVFVPVRPDGEVEAEEAQGVGAALDLDWGEVVVLPAAVGAEAAVDAREGVASLLACLGGGGGCYVGGQAEDAGAAEVPAGCVGRPLAGAGAGTSVRDLDVFEEGYLDDVDACWPAGAGYGFLPAHFLASLGCRP